MAVSFSGINENYVTFKVNGEVNSGDLVTMHSNDTVKACANGDSIVGVARSVRNGYASVQITGVVTIKYVTNAPGLGIRPMEAHASDEAVISQTGRRLLVVSQDQANGVFTAIL